VIRWSAVKAIIVRDFKEVFRSKETLFWIIAWPILWVVLSAYIFVPPGIESPRTLDIGVVNYDVESQFPMNGTYFVEIINSVEYKGAKIFNVKIYDNESSMIEDLKKGRLDGGIVIPKDFGENIIFGQANLRVYIGARDIQSAQITEGILKGFIQSVSREISLRKIEKALEYIPEDRRSFIRNWSIGVAIPINATFVEIKPKVMMARNTMIGWFTIGAIGMSLLYSGFNIGALIVIEEKERGTLKRLLSSPMTSTELLVGRTLSGLMILALMAIIVLVAGYTICGARIVWNPYKIEYWAVPLLLVMVALLTIGLGSLLSLITKTIKGATALSTIIGLLLSFLTGIWLPKWMLPEWLRVLAEVFPPTWAIEAIRAVMVFEAGIEDIAVDLIRVSTATIIAYILGVLAYRYLLRKYAEM